jgi:hypothetical protein
MVAKIRETVSERIICRQRRKAMAGEITEVPPKGRGEGKTGEKRSPGSSPGLFRGSVLSPEYNAKTLNLMMAIEWC